MSAPVAPLAAKFFILCFCVHDLIWFGVGGRRSAARWTPRWQYLRTIQAKSHTNLKHFLFVAHKQLTQAFPPKAPPPTPRMMPKPREHKGATGHQTAAQANRQPRSRPPQPLGKERVGRSKGRSKGSVGDKGTRHADRRPASLPESTGNPP